MCLDTFAAQIARRDRENREFALHHEHYARVAAQAALRCPPYSPAQRERFEELADEAERYAYRNARARAGWSPAEIIAHLHWGQEF